MRGFRIDSINRLADGMWFNQVIKDPVKTQTNTLNSIHSARHPARNTCAGHKQANYH